jgi:Uma2 family endonuclease
MLPSPGQRVLIGGVTWSELKTFLDDNGSNRCRVAYDRGTLEIMSPTLDHEKLKWLLARFVEILAEARGLAFEDAGSTTLLREGAERAIEADECFYIGSSAGAIRGRTCLDLERDPPPDLGIEIDITGSSLSKCSIYRSVGIGEVWRARERTLEFLRPRDDGGYDALVESRLFPGLRPEDLQRFLDRRHSQGSNEIVRAVRQWVKGIERPAPTCDLERPRSP